MHYLGSLADNQICGLDKYGKGIPDKYGLLSKYTAEGINALCEAFKRPNTTPKYLATLKYTQANSNQSPPKAFDCTSVLGCSLQDNSLDDAAKQAVKAAAESRVTFAEMAQEDMAKRLGRAGYTVKAPARDKVELLL